MIAVEAYLRAITVTNMSQKFLPTRERGTHLTALFLELSGYKPVPER